MPLRSTKRTADPPPGLHGMSCAADQLKPQQVLFVKDKPWGRSLPAPLREARVVDRCAPGTDASRGYRDRFNPHSVSRAAALHWKESVWN